MSAANGMKAKFAAIWPVVNTASLFASVSPSRNQM